MLAFLPIIGPIIQGITSIFTGYFNTKVQLKQADVQQDIAETQASTQIIQATQDDIGLRLMRDLMCFPIVLWTTLVSWDTIVALRYPEWMFHVAGFDKTSVPYLPYAVIVFLLGNIGINMWNRK